MTATFERIFTAAQGTPRACNGRRRAHRFSAMFFRMCLLVPLALASARLTAADAVFTPAGKRVIFLAPGEGQLAYLDLDDREKNAPSSNVMDVAHAGGPKRIQGIAYPKKGNLLIAAPDAVWSYDPAVPKAARIASLPAKFNASDLAFQETTGAILVWGTFLRDDNTVDRFAVFRIGKGESKAVPVYAGGIDSFERGAFDAAGQFYFAAKADLWGADIIATEHQQAGEFDWQVRGFRLAALGTPVSGEAPNAGHFINALAAGGGKIFAVLGGDEGGAVLRLTAPTFARHKEGPLNRLVNPGERWAFQQKLIASAQTLTAANALPRNPIVAVSGDGARVVYQTAATGVRRWWLLEKGPKPRLLVEESD